MTLLRVHSAGPGMTLQDLGRPGHQAAGLSQGGAADRKALYEGVALLQGNTPPTAIEMAGMGGKFEIVGGAATVALTGAPMRARCNGRQLSWNAGHVIDPGSVLEIGPAVTGVYGYLSIAGGFDTALFMGAQSAHLNAGIGSRFAAGDEIPIGASEFGSEFKANLTDRFSGGELRVLPSPQIERFTEDVVSAFAQAKFVRTARGNRMGVELSSGQSYGATDGLSVVSEMVIPGDVQMTGQGAPFILGPECQTTGGYPRIATVIPPDLGRAMQAAPGTQFTFRFVDRKEALAAFKEEQNEIMGISVEPTIRNPHDIADLLSYQLVGGIYEGDEQ